VSYNAGGCADTFTQLVALKDFTDPHLSTNVITPNGDHYNDDVYVNIQDETSFELVIYDRTGNPVFRSKDKNVHWDGKNTFNGSDCLPGTYYYSLTYSFRSNSEPHVKNGAITLIR
jgi:gliding motility-associated-like protein